MGTRQRLPRVDGAKEVAIDASDAHQALQQTRSAPNVTPFGQRGCVTVGCGGGALGMPYSWLGPIPHSACGGRREIDAVWTAATDNRD